MTDNQQLLQVQETMKTVSESIYEREQQRRHYSGGESSFWSSHESSSRISHSTSNTTDDDDDENTATATNIVTSNNNNNNNNNISVEPSSSFSRKRRNRLSVASQISIQSNNLDMYCCCCSSSDDDENDDVVISIDPMRPLQALSSKLLQHPCISTIKNDKSPTSYHDDYDPQQQQDEFEPWIRNILQLPSLTLGGGDVTSNTTTSRYPTTNIDWAYCAPGQYQTTLYRRPKLTATKSSNVFVSPLSRGTSTSIISSSPSLLRNSSNMPRSASSPDLRHVTSRKSPQRRNIFPSSTTTTSTPRTLNTTENDSLPTTTPAKKGLNYLNLGIREVPIEEDEEEEEDANKNINDILFPSAAAKRIMVVQEEEEQEEEVDMSLGMKLTIIGGNVIVQDLVPLKDGRASPAQLSGKISVGDVLLAVDNKSLQGLEISALVAALQPLKGPTKQQQQQADLSQQQQLPEDDSMSITSNWTRQTQQTTMSQRSTTTNKSLSNTMQMQVTLLFAIGEGLPLLLREKEQQQQQPDDLMLTTFGHFGGVDSFSGIPFLPFGGGSGDVISTATTEPTVSLSDSKNATALSKKPEVQEPSKTETSPSAALKKETNIFKSAKSQLPEAKVVTSTNAKVSPISRHSTATKSAVAVAGKFLTPQQQKLSKISLYISVAKESSFIEWYSNYFDFLEDMPTLLRYDDDTAIAQKKLLEQQAEILSKEEKIKRGTSVIQDAVATFDREEELDKRRDSLIEDSVTISLITEKRAANKKDDIKEDDFVNWKSNIVSLLEKAEKEAMENVNKHLSPALKKMNGGGVATNQTAKISDGDVTIEGLLFGKHVVQIFNRKKSAALPDASLSSTLYSIIRQLAEPDSTSEVLVVGKQEKIEFLISSGLPIWMKTFKPLKWQYRRILWPVQTTSATLTHGKSDELSSIASSSVSGSVTTSASLFSNFQQKPSTANVDGSSPMTLENIVEELELNPETRVHACFLVSFYFTRAIYTMTQEKALKFVRSFGAYLNLSEALAVSSRLRYEKVIDLLLDMAAKYDVIHKKAKLEFDKIKTGLAMGDQPPLSVLLQYLKERTLENSAVLPFLISGYPDLQPWIVRKSAYNVLGSLESQKNYYEYLSTLLDPMYGYELARGDIELVRDWCILSVTSDLPDYRANFYSVAKGPNKIFKRDLPLLLDLSMKLSDYELSLSLAAELLADPIFSFDSAKVEIALNYMHRIIEFAVASDIVDANLLSRVFECWSLLLAKRGDIALPNFMELSDELGFAIALCEEDAAKLNAVVEVIVTAFPPAKALEVIELCNPRGSKLMLRSLRTILTRSAMDDYRIGLSGALLRVRRAHQALKKKTVPTIATTADNGSVMVHGHNTIGMRRGIPPNGTEEKSKPYFDAKSIWCDVLEGAVLIEK